MSETPPAGDAPQTGASAVKAAQIAPEPPPPPKKGLFHRLYDPQTRFGRGNRAFTRGLGLVVGLFALGLLTGYTLLFQPLEKSYRAEQVQQAQANAALESLHADLKSAQSSLVDAEQERKTTAAELVKAQARLDVQRAMVKVVETRLALAQKDSAAARLALGEAEKIFLAMKPALSAEEAKSLDQVLALAKSDLPRGANLADQDLVRLISELELIDQGFGQ
jgi:hypothetical protein